MVSEQRKEWERQYYLKHADKFRAKKRIYSKQYYHANKDKVKIYHKKYYEENKNSIREKSREYYQHNKDIFDECRQHWFEENPEKKREISSRYRARKNSAKGNITANEFTDICEKQNWLCAYCGEHKPLALEHTQPLSRGGSHEASNIVGSCKNCNSEKHNSTLKEFLDRIGLTMDEFKIYAPHLSYFNVHDLSPTTQ